MDTEKNNAELLPLKRPRDQNKDEKHRETLKVRRLNKESNLPFRATKGAGGYDLSSTIDGVIPARGKINIDLGIAIRIPKGYVGLIKIRSSLGNKSLDTGAGVIDSDYRGPITAILFNHSDQDFEVTKGSRIAQLLILKIFDGEVEEVEELDLTERGEGGFGSTGSGNEKQNT
jgi:deoxyuridine 5'-triphosphate nucleotidohydrolase